MMIDCPHCQETIEASEESAGEAMRCPHCAQDFLVPELHAVTASQSPAVMVQARATAQPVVRPRVKATPQTSGGGSSSSGGGKGALWIVLLLAAAGGAYYFRAEWMPVAQK